MTPKLYRGTIAYDDDDLTWHRGMGRNPEKRLAWYKKYWKTEKYLDRQKEYQREYRRKKRIGHDQTKASVTAAAK